VARFCCVDVHLCVSIAPCLASMQAACVKKHHSSTCLCSCLLASDHLYHTGLRSCPVGVVFAACAYMQTDTVLPNVDQDAEQAAEQAAAEAAAALLLEEEELAACAAAKEAKKQKAKAKRKQAQQPQSNSSKPAQIDDPGHDQPAEADSADIQSEAGSQSAQTASPGQTSAYAESSDLMLSPPQSVNADSSLNMHDAPAAVSTQEEGEQWVQAAATSKKGRAHKAKAMQQQAGLHWQPWSKPQSDSQLPTLPQLGLQADIPLQTYTHAQSQPQSTVYPVPSSLRAQSQLNSEQDSQLLLHLQPCLVTGKRPEQSCQGNADRIATAPGDLPACDTSGRHPALQLLSHTTSKGLLLFGSMPPMEQDLIYRGKELHKDLLTNMRAAAELEASWLCDRIPQKRLRKLLQCPLTQVSSKRQ